MVEAGRNLKPHLVATPCHVQGHLPFVQSPIQPGLRYLQRWGSICIFYVTTENRNIVV